VSQLEEVGGHRYPPGSNHQDKKVKTIKEKEKLEVRLKRQGSGLFLG